MPPATQEAAVYDYLSQYRATINLAGLATACGIDRNHLTQFLGGHRGLGPTATAALWKYFSAQHEAMALFRA